MAEKIWQIKEKAPHKFRNEHPEFSSVFADLLWQRGLRTSKVIDTFLKPEYERDSSDPFLLKDAKKAVKILKKFLLKKEPIIIFGDYDVDGVCGTTILFNLFCTFSSPVPRPVRLRSPQVPSTPLGTSRSGLSVTSGE